MKKDGFFSQLKRGILDENPVFVQLLGMCPTLALTTLVSNAIGMGLAATAVLVCSNLLISLLRHIIPKQVRIAAYIVIISGFVTAVELIMKAYLFDLYQSLGIFLSLIVVNCIILARAEAYASKNKPLPSIVDGIATGLGFTFALIVMAAIREVIGSGTILGYDITFGVYEPAMMIAQPAGAFITLGIIIAAVQKIKNSVEDKKRLKRLSHVEPKERGDKE
ncbi:MAG: electron transport complex subunit E [Clostridia bacterium]|nr:electron transport complex subunit E [Clostridia bacterium]